MSNQNFVLAKKGNYNTVKLIDFGTSQIVKRGTYAASPTAGTLYYVSPERLFRNRYSFDYDPTKNRIELSKKDLDNNSFIVEEMEGATNKFMIRDHILKIEDKNVTKESVKSLLNKDGPAQKVLVKRKLFNSAADIWSLGVNFFLLTYGNVPFWAKNNQGIYNKIRAGFKAEEKPGVGPWFPESMPRSEAFHDLIEKMLKNNDKDRITVDDALKHEYFTEAETRTEYLHVTEPVASKIQSAETIEIEMITE